jgi:Kef-type K+ transport system membrane component KefB
MSPPKRVHPTGRRDFIAGIVLITLIMTLAVLLANLHAYRTPATFFIPAAVAIFSITVTFIIVAVDTHRTDEIENEAA